MVDPTRLADGEAGFESAVLGAWHDRQPSEAARTKALAALGLSGLALTAAGSAAGKAGASIAPKAVIASSLLKWLGIGAGLAATAGAIGYVSLRTTPEVTSTTARARAPMAAAASASPVAARPPVGPFGRTPAGPSPVAVESSSPSVVSASPLDPSRAVVARVTQGVATTAARTGTSAPNAKGATNDTATKTTTAATSPSSLDEEVLAVDRARRALAAGDGAAALDLVDAYDAKYPNGALSQESAELRIEALFRVGKRASAEALAARFLAAHPTSPYARVIRSLLTGAAPAAP